MMRMMMPCLPPRHILRILWYNPTYIYGDDAHNTQHVSSIIVRTIHKKSDRMLCQCTAPLPCKPDNRNDLLAHGTALCLAGSPDVSLHLLIVVRAPQGFVAKRQQTTTCSFHRAGDSDGGGGGDRGNGRTHNSFHRRKSDIADILHKDRIPPSVNRALASPISRRVFLSPAGDHIHNDTNVDDDNDTTSTIDDATTTGRGDRPQQQR